MNKAAGQSPTDAAIFDTHDEGRAGTRGCAAKARFNRRAQKAGNGPFVESRCTLRQVISFQMRGHTHDQTHA